MKLKKDTTAMTATENEVCVGWLHENSWEPSIKYVRLNKLK